MLVAGLLAWRSTGLPWLGLAGGLFLAVAVRAYFLPRTYALDEQGAREEGPLQAPRRLGWNEVRRVTRERLGVHLSPFHRTSRWLPDRGLFLRTAGNREDVMSYVESRVEVS